MKYLKLKKYLPRSFFGRALLIIILPIIFLEAIIGFAFIQRYFEQVTTQLAKSTVLQINYVLDRYDNILSDEEKYNYFKNICDNIYGEDQVKFITDLNNCELITDDTANIVGNTNDEFNKQENIKINPNKTIIMTGPVSEKKEIEVKL